MVEFDLHHYGGVRDHRPGKDKYLSARAFEFLPPVYGEKGKFLVDFYTYFRWFDDIADSPIIPVEDRLEFISRQKRLISGEFIQKKPSPIEEFYNKIDFDILPGETRKLVKGQFFMLAQSIHEDVRYYGLYARTRREIRHNNLRTMIPYAETISLVLNGKPIRVTSEFADLLDNWNYMGALLHLPKDLGEEKIIKIGFSNSEAKQINQIKRAEDRLKKIQDIYTPERYRGEWQYTLNVFRARCNSFADLDIPSYQKLISFLYLSIREPIRLPNIFEGIENKLQEGKEESLEYSI